LTQVDPQLRRAGCDPALTTEPPDRPIVGRWDRRRVEQIIVNLVSNAVKFGAGKPVEIRVEQQDGIARLSITDHGIGIEPMRMKHLFERFSRGVPAENYGGLGLGLYICREITDAHGGSIRVASRLEHGSTFTVELPLRRPSEQSAPPRNHC